MLPLVTFGFTTWAFLVAFAIGFDPGAVAPGAKSWGFVNVADDLAGKIDLPVLVVHGSAPGPTLTVTAGLYAMEYCGIEAAGRIYAQSDPQQLRGKLVLVPVVNMPAFQFRTPTFDLAKSLTPVDGKDINAAFPGRLNGTLTDVLAYRLLHDIVLAGDYHIDLRGGEISESHLSHAIFLQQNQGCHDQRRRCVNHQRSCRRSPWGTEDPWRASLELAIVFGLPYIIFEPEYVQPGPLIYEAIVRGIPSMVSEAGRGYDPQPMEEHVGAHVQGVVNVLCHLGMLPGQPKRPAVQRFLEPDRFEIFAPVAGIFKHLLDAGERAKAGQTIGIIGDLDNTTLSEIRAPHDVIVHEMMPRRLVHRGDRIYHLAVVGALVPSQTEFLTQV